MNATIIHRCSYCSKIYKTERGYHKHIENCIVRKKKDYLNSVDGQRAFMYFQYWMKLKCNGVNVSVNSFTTSKYYNAFCSFVAFIKVANIPDSDGYIALMVRLNVDPFNWYSDAAYGKYLEYMTDSCPPLKLVKISVTTLYDVSEQYGCDICDIFSVIDVNEFITLLSQRNISPWLLLHSKKFADFYINNMNASEQTTVEKLINPDFWTLKFKNDKESVENIHKIVHAIGI